MCESRVSTSCLLWYKTFYLFQSDIRNRLETTKKISLRYVELSSIYASFQRVANIFLKFLAFFFTLYLIDFKSAVTQQLRI